jgi:serine/threonine-protein kinase HipA
VADALHLWMNGELVGVWTTTRTGTPLFRYDDAWLQSPNSRPLSLSLPITTVGEIRGDAVIHYFDNLLPDSDAIRRRLRTRFRTRGTNAFDLLKAIGRDCVGAVQLLPPDCAPEAWDRIESQALTDTEVERILVNVTSDNTLRFGGEDDDFRISIAGAQEKTALLKIDDTWHRPHAATPTTHILKLPLGMVGNLRVDMRDSVENEWLCARILRELGLRVADTAMAQFGEQKALVVTRFDRRWIERDTAGSAWIARLPQEDFCQATATAAERKYETDGGPSIRTCLDLLAASEQADDDRREFVLLQLAFWLLAATDGHAKNFSLFVRQGGRFVMTPAYDVLSAWPIVGTGAQQLPLQKVKLAMALHAGNVHYRLHEIQPRHWRALAEKCGVAEMWQRMQQFVAAVPAALDRVVSTLPADFPVNVSQPICAGMRRQTELFERGI